MVLEWLPNQLAGVLAQGDGALVVSTAVGIAGQIARGLAALHEHGIVHRDLKAANVLLSESDPARARACLADLGLAKVGLEHAEGGPVLEHVSTGGGARLGTWDYMAPEQWIKSKTVSPKADVYSLGVLLFLMLAGRLPFPADQAKDLMFFHLFEEPPMGYVAGNVPPQVVKLLKQMLEKTAPPRPSMVEVVERLSAIG
jgi:serine/threonine-protein kinase